MDKTKVCIAIPTRGADIYYKQVFFLINQLNKPETLVSIMFGQSALGVFTTMECIFENAMKMDVDYLVVIDTDVCPPDDAIAKLISHKKDIVVAPVWHYCENTNQIHLNIHYTKALDRIYVPKEHGLERIFASSFACTCVSRHAMDVFRDKKEHPVGWSPLLNESMRRCPTDNIFFSKAEILGLEAYVDWDIHDSVHYRAIKLSQDTLLTFLRTIDNEEMPNG